MKKTLSVILSLVMIISITAGLDFSAHAASKPKTTSISSITAKSGAFTVKWKKVKSVTGYQIQYSTNSKFKKNKKIIKVSNASTTSKTIKNLKSRKKYYVRIRSYKKSKKKTFYSTWSKSKSVTTKVTATSAISKKLSSNTWMIVYPYPGDNYEEFTFTKDGKFEIISENNHGRFTKKGKYKIVNNTTATLSFTYDGNTYKYKFSTISGSNLLKVEYKVNNYSETLFATKDSYKGNNSEFLKELGSTYWNSKTFSSKYSTFQCVVIHEFSNYDQTGYIAVNHGGYYMNGIGVTNNLAMFSWEDSSSYNTVILEKTSDPNTINAFIFLDGKGSYLYEKWTKN